MCLMPDMSKYKITPITKHNYRLEEPIMKILYGAIERPSSVRL